MIKTIKIIDDEQDDCVQIKKKDLKKLKIEEDKVIDAENYIDGFVNRSCIAEVRTGSELKDRALYIFPWYEPQIVKDHCGSTCIIFKKKKRL